MVQSMTGKELLEKQKYDIMPCTNEVKKWINENIVSGGKKTNDSMI